MMCLAKRSRWIVFLGGCLAVGCTGQGTSGGKGVVQEPPQANSPAGTSEKTSAPNAGPASSNSPPANVSPSATKDPPTNKSPKRKKNPSEIEDITFDDIKLDLQKDEPYQEKKLTDRVKELDGQNIRIRGYILPTFIQNNLTQFVLVRDNMACCFGPGAALHDCIIVEMLPGKSTDFSVRPVAVEGKFTIQEYKDIEGKHRAIYHLDGNSVK